MYDDIITLDDIIITTFFATFLAMVTVHSFRTFPIGQYLDDLCVEKISGLLTPLDDFLNFRLVGEIQRVKV